MILNFKNFIKSLNIGDWFTTERINSPNNKTKTTVKDSDIGGDVIGRDKNEFNNTTTHSISNLEKKVLKVLYLQHQRDQSVPRRLFREICEILEIKDGTWVAPLNDSKYLKIDGEFVVMNADGLRYMDNLDPSELNKIVLPEEQRKWDEAIEQQNKRFEENQKRRKSYR